MQGALMVNGRIGTSSSARKGNPGVFTAGAPGQAPAGHPWGAGPEDLTYATASPGGLVTASLASGRVYSLTEHPGARVVFGVPAASLGP